MIESTLEFEHASLEQALRAFLTLPEGLRPSHCSRGEDEKSDLITDPEKFVVSAINQTPGPYLKNLLCTYDISLAGDKPIICNCFLEVEPMLARQFLIHMAAAQPTFGFACAQEERYQRNRVTTKQGINTIESWVGRDPQKYVPGFYWLTLLSESLAAQHSVPLSAVEKVAQEHIELEGGQHLFRFYERPKDWQTTSDVAALISSLPGVFDVEKVKPQLAAAKNFLDLHAVTKNWK